MSNARTPAISLLMMLGSLLSHSAEASSNRLTEDDPPGADGPACPAIYGQVKLAAGGARTQRAVTGITFTKIADTSTPIPGGTGNFTAFSHVALSDGRVAFKARGADGQVGIYLYCDGVLRAVADTSTLMPGSGIPFMEFGPPSLDQENVAFIGWNGDIEGVYADIGGLVVIAYSSMPVPGSAGTFEGFGRSEYSKPSIEGDQVAFLGYATLPSGWEESGVYAGNHESLRVVADERTPVPGGQGNFTQFGTDGGPAMSDGRIAFWARGVHTTEKPYAGIFAEFNDTDSLITIVDSQTPAPDGGLFSDYFGDDHTAPTISGTTVAFQGHPSLGPGGIFANVDGVIRYIGLCESNDTPTHSLYGTRIVIERDHTFRYYSGQTGSQICRIVGPGDTFPGGVMTRSRCISPESLEDHQFAFGAEFAPGEWAVYIANNLPDSSPTLYVDDDAPPGGDGLSWATAYDSLQDALTNASTNGAVTGIQVAGGTYRPSLQTEPGVHRTETFSLLDGVTIAGGYAGLAVPENPDARDRLLYPSTLSGDLVGDDAEGTSPYDLLYEPTRAENAYHVVTANGTDETAVLDGFTVTGGNANEYPHLRGGGLFNDSGSPTLRHCTFYENSALYEGGGMYSISGSSTLMHCTFCRNAALFDGGGIYNKSGALLVTECTFNDNKVRSRGGAMYNYSSSPTLIACTFRGNSAYDGGAICNTYSSPSMIRCSITGNGAYAGGGISNRGESSPALMNCTLAENAAINGGGMYSIGSSPSLANCLLHANSAVKTGGAVAIVDGGHPTLTNCTFAANSAWSGRAVECRSPSSVPTVHGSLALTNSILRNGGNEIGNADDPHWTVTVTYSNVEGGWPGEGNSDADPLFVDADGPDNLSGTADDNFRLLPGSPCADAGNNNTVPLDVFDLDGDADVDETIPLDLDDNPRLVDDAEAPDSGVGTPPLVDLGAYEGPKLALLLSTESVSVPEGATGSFTVVLSSAPTGTVHVSVAHQSGDQDVSVLSGTTLTFHAFNYDDPQTVTLGADEDQDYVNGVALIALTAPDIPAAAVTAAEHDNEAAPAVLYVDGRATGANDGTSWTNALTCLQEAMSVVAASPQVQEVRVGHGVYRPASPGGPRSASFRLAGGVALRGGYAGCGAANPDARDTAVYPTVLSGDLNGDDGPGLLENNEENSYHVVTSGPVDSSSMLEGFTITAGFASGPPWKGDNLGGGMRNDGGSPTLIGCVLKDNAASSYYKTSTEGGDHGYGGGLHTAYGDPVLTNCLFERNLACAGGGMSNDEGSPTVESSLFYANHAECNDGEGAALYSRTGVVVLENSTFGHNTSDGWTAMTVSNYGEVVVTGSIFWSHDDWPQTDEETLGPHGTVTINYSCVEGWTGVFGGLGNTGEDPLFVAPGPDYWEAGESQGDHRLQPDSPCINAGDPAFVPEPGATDLEGHSRLLCSIVDMGAYEFGIGDHDCDRSVDLLDYLNWPGCFTGPLGGPYADGCEAFDFDFDGDVDLLDFAGFQGVFEEP